MRIAHLMTVLKFGFKFAGRNGSSRGCGSTAKEVRACGGGGGIILPWQESSMAPFSSFSQGIWTHKQVWATGGLVAMGMACAPVTTLLQAAGCGWNQFPAFNRVRTYSDLVSNKQHGNILQRKRERRKKIPVYDCEDTLNCNFYYLTAH